jgi:hypothetical protein
MSVTSYDVSDLTKAIKCLEQSVKLLCAHSPGTLGGNVQDKRKFRSRSTDSRTNFGPPGTEIKEFQGAMVRLMLK